MCKCFWFELILVFFICDGSVYMDISFWDYWFVGNCEDDGNEDFFKVYLR